MKPIYVKSTHINFGAEKNDKDLKFEVDDHVRILKQKHVCKVYT